MLETCWLFRMNESIVQEAIFNNDKTSSFSQTGERALQLWKTILGKTVPGGTCVEI